MINRKLKNTDSAINPEKRPTLDTRHRMKRNKANTQQYKLKRGALCLRSAKKNII